MTANTKIEWCDSTFNPWIGCTKISPACDHCYAEAQMDTRMGRVQWGAGQTRARTSAAYWKQPLRWNAKPFRQCKECGWRGDDKARGHMPFDTESDTAPIKGCPSCGSYDFADARRRVFCASLADVFDNEVDPVWRADLINLIGMTPNLDWLLLTKRIGNAAAMLKEAKDYWAFSNRPGKDWQNIWLGATICNQSEADRDIPKLLATPAAIRFLSIEPMLGPIDLERPMPGPDLHQGGGGMICQPWYIQSGIDWVICGGESGPHARPMHPDWARSLRDQCAAAGVPFLFKQFGEWAPYRLHVNGDLGGDLRSGRVQHLHAPGNPEGFFRRGDAYMERVGKHRAGRLLDGVEHNGVPA